MSAGKFTISKYETDDGDIRPIRVQEETITMTIGGVANAAPGGAVTDSGRVRVSGGNRRIGLKARNVTIAFNEEGAPDGYKVDSPITLPILTEAVWDGITDGETVSYLGGTGRVLGKGREAGK